MRTLTVVLIALSLAACSDDARTAGGVSKGEAEALDDAAAMVEEQRLPAEPAAAPPTSDEPANK